MFVGVEKQLIRIQHRSFVLFSPSYDDNVEHWGRVSVYSRSPLTADDERMEWNETSANVARKYVDFS